MNIETDELFNINEETQSSNYDYDEREENGFKKVSTFNIVNTNARSITPKIECFIDYLNELNSSLAFLTETWLTDTSDLDDDIKAVSYTHLTLPTIYSV